MAQLGFKHIAAEASPRLVCFGGPPDELWRINLEQAGSHMVRSGLLTEAELDECLNLLDTHILLISGILESRRGAKNHMPDPIGGTAATLGSLAL
jgi:hypothetical protein